VLDIVDIIRQVAVYFPNIKKELYRAHIKVRLEDFIKKAFVFSTVGSVSLSVFFGLLFMTFGVSLLFLLLILPALFAFFFYYYMLTPKYMIIKRQRELDREVLFAGRFLLVKVHSGTPLIKAIEEGAQGYGISGKYFKEILDDINLGTPIERALENAMNYSPSEKFRKILFQIITALKVGIDITGPLKETLDEITAEQLNEIKRYGKKLNSLAMFYMLLAVVMPSLGMTMFVVIGSLIKLPITPRVYIGVLFFLFILQFIFVIIFKGTRLAVNL